VQNHQAGRILISSPILLLISIGTCSSFGGIPAAGPNPAGVVSLQALTGRKTINVSGCPPHPTWMVWTLVQLLQGKKLSLDSSGRPSAIYKSTVHSQCPNRGTSFASSFAQPNHCLRQLGCRGPQTGANCPVQKWNNGVNWCIGAEAPCLGCTSPDFPGTSRFYNQP
jgi:NiFe hydrogenase small subunit HydA